MIVAPRPHLFVAATTHPGMKGKNNEDRYAVSAFFVDDQNRTPSAFAIVSDGVGGHRAGEVASEMAVEIIGERIAQSDASQPPLIMQDAIIAASEAIRKRAELDPAQKGMGATCVCAWVIGDRLYTATVGDSRLYLMRAHTIRKLSTDHTWVQEAIDHGAISPDQARNHPNAHVIRRYLGSPQIVVPDLRLRLRPEDTDSQAEGNQGLPLLPGDVLLLCSDGLTDLVDDPEILEAVETRSLEGALTWLEGLANLRGGHDNITIIGMQMPPAGVTLTNAPNLEDTKPLFLETIRSDATQQIKKTDLATAQKGSPRRKRLILVTCIGIALVILLGGGILGALTWFATHPVSATSSPTIATITPSVAGSASSQPSVTSTSTNLPTATLSQTPQPPQATITPWPTNTLPPATDTPPNPFITSTVMP
jgi:PPM family protein phosphatase